MQTIRGAQLIILLMRHCSKCDSKCKYGKTCDTGKKIFRHVLSCCGTPGCGTSMCPDTTRLLVHYARCQSASCEVCVPVRAYIRNRRRSASSPTRRRSRKQDSPTRSAM